MQPCHQRDISFITHSVKGNKKHKTYLKNQHGFLYARAPDLMSSAFHDIATRSAAHWIFFCYPWSYTECTAAWCSLFSSLMNKNTACRAPAEYTASPPSNPSSRLAPPHSSLFFILLFMLFLVLGLIWRCDDGFYT